MSTSMTPTGGRRLLASSITKIIATDPPDPRGGLHKSFPHCIAYKLPKETVKSVIENIFKKSPAKDATSVYTASDDWIQSLSTSIANELSANFNVPAENFSESSTKIANVVSGIGNGTWSS
ncbi:18289_t:CDS:1, partial [Rhizophagus irregularis]